MVHVSEPRADGPEADGPCHCAYSLWGGLAHGFGISRALLTGAQDPSHPGSIF